MLAQSSNPRSARLNVCTLLAVPSKFTFCGPEMNVAGLPSQLIGEKMSVAWTRAMSGGGTVPNCVPSQNLVALVAPCDTARGLFSGANQAGTYLFGAHGTSGGTRSISGSFSLMNFSSDQE